MWEAPVKNYRTSVGLDVHARSVFGCGLDGETGEVFERRLTPDPREILAWVQSLPGPVAVTYEAGPTGFVLARFLLAAGMVCLVAAPSKLQRPSGDRVKTDTRDARYLARLLHLGEIVEVTIPSIEQEAARDLVRAREDARGDLMSARHRVSKLLLRQGIVYCGGKAWTGKHELCGYVRTDSTPQGGNWPTTRHSMPWCPPWTGVIDSIKRSLRWPPIQGSPRW
ncbi:MAG: putative transposase y4qE [Mycobacterium sp.]|jgi:transposase|nr:putative transposase y4qE [Mycobacterium sp.]